MTDHLAVLEELAILLWHRFAPDDHIEWEDETHKAEYRDVAEAAIALMRGQSEDAEARNEAYDRVDHYLRNSLMDAAYAEYSEALDIACGYAAPPKDSADEQ